MKSLRELQFSKVYKEIAHVNRKLLLNFDMGEVYYLLREFEYLDIKSALLLDTECSGLSTLLEYYDIVTSRICLCDKQPAEMESLILGSSGSNRTSYDCIVVDNSNEKEVSDELWLSCLDNSKSTFCVCFTNIVRNGELMGFWKSLKRCKRYIEFVNQPAWKHGVGIIYIDS